MTIYNKQQMIILTFEREIQRIPELLFSLYIICIIIPDLKLKDII